MDDYETWIVNTARSLSYTVSGFNRYVRVNDFIVDTACGVVVAMAWPRAAPKTFPVRVRAHSVDECFD